MEACIVILLATLITVAALHGQQQPTQSPPQEDERPPLYW